MTIERYEKQPSDEMSQPATEKVDLEPLRQDVAKLVEEETAKKEKGNVDLVLVNADELTKIGLGIFKSYREGTLSPGAFFARRKLLQDTGNKNPSSKSLSDWLSNKIGKVESKNPEQAEIDKIFGGASKE